jgi:hypothetical protein
MHTVWKQAVMILWMLTVVAWWDPIQACMFMFVTEYLIVQFVRNTEINLEDVISKTVLKEMGYPWSN